MQGLLQPPRAMWVPEQQPYWPAYSPHHLWSFLQRCLAEDRDHHPLPPHPGLLFIGFSAGVIGSIGAARQWQSQGRKVKACIALDGWGVPLFGAFPIHRISHDQWTHYSSHLLGGSGVSFVANPGVEHLDLWRSPHTTVGTVTAAPFNVDWGPPIAPEPLQWGGDRALSPSSEQPRTVAQFIHQLLQEYGEV
ncbi:MAG: hypothetical protein AB4042_01065 [Leptolyngbyaceae cyanobacterium]